MSPKDRKVSKTWDTEYKLFVAPEILPRGKCATLQELRASIVTSSGTIIQLGSGGIFRFKSNPSNDQQCNSAKSLCVHIETDSCHR